MAVKSITRCSVNEMISNVIRIREIIHGEESQVVCRKDNKNDIQFNFSMQELKG